MKSFYRAMRLYLEPGRIPWPFLLGTILLSVISNAAYDWLKEPVGGPLAVLLIAFSFFALMIGFAILIPQIFRRAICSYKIESRRGLIVLVSQSEYKSNAAIPAIDYHAAGEKVKLDHLWLIATEKPKQEPPEPSQSSWKNAQDLQNRYAGKIKVFPKYVTRDDPSLVSMAVKQAVEEAKARGLKPNDLVADATGGTKPMTIGMVLGTLMTGIDVTYLSPRKTASSPRTLRGRPWRLAQIGRAHV